MLGIKAFGSAHISLLRHRARSFKLIHVIREPLAMSVSGYWYHLHSGDHPRGAGPLELSVLNLTAGLELNARAMLRCCVQPMVENTHAIAGDGRFLTFDISDIGDDWKAVALRVSAFLFSGSPGPTARLLASPSPFKGAGDATAARLIGHHIASVSNTSRAFAAIEASRDAVWDELRAARQRLGYANTPRGWRYIPSSRS